MKLAIVKALIDGKKKRYLFLTTDNKLEDDRIKSKFMRDKLNAETNSTREIREFKDVEVDSVELDEFLEI